MIIYTTRNFSAAHSLPGYPGPCSKMHGHTWKVEVWIKGHVDITTGMVVDFKEVKNVIDMLDHVVLNSKNNNPTAENLAGMLSTSIQLVLPVNVRVIKLRLWESENSYAEFSS